MRLIPLVAAVLSLSALADGSKRDPFVAPVAAVRKEPECKRGSCRFAVRELTLVAVVSGTGRGLAMLEDPEGTGYVVKPGMVVARERARVVRIARDTVTVEIPDGLPAKLELKLSGTPAEEPLDLSKPEK